MSRLVFTSDHLARLRKYLLASPLETCAILTARPVSVDGKVARLVVTESYFPDSSHYSARTSTRAVLKPEFFAPLAKRAGSAGESLVFVHSHPSGPANFSLIDGQGEEALREFLERRLPHGPHVSMLVAPAECRARFIGTNQALDVFGSGPDLIFYSRNRQTADKEQFDRQIRALGVDGQKRLQQLRVAIVGLGGTGSVVLQQLAHLGISDFLLIDPDTLEPSNLNRVVGSRPTDMGQSKGEIARRVAVQVNPGVSVEVRQESVLNLQAILKLADVDMVFCCTDSHGSRAIVNQFAYQYFVPVIDMGVVIAVHDGAITNAASRTQMLAPGLPCLVCAGLLDPNEVRRDFMTEFERKQDPYVLGDSVPQPAVISLNSTAASLAVTMFLAASVGFPAPARLINYNALTSMTRSAALSPHPTCIVCSQNGALGKADTWPLPGRSGIDV